MNKKLTAVLIIMAIIPIALLSWMGIAGIRSVKENSRHQIQIIAEQELKHVGDRISDIILNIKENLGQLIKDNGVGIDEIRNTIRKQNLIRQIFIADKDSLLYPLEDIGSNKLLSNKEKTFLIRIKETDISYNFLQKSLSEDNTNRLNEGWHTWFMGDGINFIFWQKREASVGKSIIEGIELNRSALLSEIINKLPETNNSNLNIRIILRNASRKILYQWGKYFPPDNMLPIAELSLNAPVNTWYLEYFIDPESYESGNTWVTFIVSILTILIVIVSLSIYLFRESTREMREASQKVSFVN